MHIFPKKTVIFKTRDASGRPVDINSKIKLNNGIQIPVLGLGVWKTAPGKETENAVLAALKAGYRHIDTAAIYHNEADVGAAIRKSGIPRKEIFITTKLWNADHDDPEDALDQSLRSLHVEYVDLYLIHWPVEKLRANTWKTMERLYNEGVCKAIGVSNYTLKHMKELLLEAEVKPAVNQVEFHPYLYQKELLDFCQSKGIIVEAYSPLAHGKKLDDPKLMELAKKYGKTCAQIMIRWALQKGMVALPKSKTKERIEENAHVFDFEIKEADMKKLDALHCNLRTCWDPTPVP